MSEFKLEYNGEVSAKLGSMYTGYFEVKQGECQLCEKNHLPVIHVYAEPKGSRDMRSSTSRKACLGCIVNVFATHIEGSEGGIRDTRNLIRENKELPDDTCLACRGNGWLYSCKGISEPDVRCPVCDGSGKKNEV